MNFSNATTPSKLLIPVFGSSYYFYTVLLLVTVAVATTNLSLTVSSWLSHPCFLSPQTQCFFPKLLSWTALQGKSKGQLICSLYLPGPGLQGCSGTWRRPSLLCPNSCHFRSAYRLPRLIVLLCIVLILRLGFHKPLWAWPKCWRKQ